MFSFVFVIWIGTDIGVLFLSDSGVADAVQEEEYESDDGITVLTTIGVLLLLVTLTGIEQGNTFLNDAKKKKDEDRRAHTIEVI